MTSSPGTRSDTSMSWAQKAANGLSKSWKAMLDHPGLSLASGFAAAFAIGETHLQLQGAGVDVNGGVTATLASAALAGALITTVMGSDNKAHRESAAQSAAVNLNVDIAAAEKGAPIQLDARLHETLSGVAEHKQYWKAFNEVMDDNPDSRAAVIDYLREQGVSVDSPDALASNHSRELVADAFGVEPGSDTLLHANYEDDLSMDATSSPRLG